MLIISGLSSSNNLIPISRTIIKVFQLTLFYLVITLLTFANTNQLASSSDYFKSCAKHGTESVDDLFRRV